MKVDTFAENEDIICIVNCSLEDQRQKLFYNKINVLLVSTIHCCNIAQLVIGI